MNNPVSSVYDVNEPEKGGTIIDGWDIFKLKLSIVRSTRSLGMWKCLVVEEVRNNSSYGCRISPGQKYRFLLRGFLLRRCCLFVLHRPSTSRRIWSARGGWWWCRRRSPCGQVACCNSFLVFSSSSGFRFFSELSGSCRRHDSRCWIPTGCTQCTACRLLSRLHGLIKSNRNCCSSISVRGRFRVRCRLKRFRWTGCRLSLGNWTWDRPPLCPSPMHRHGGRINA